MEEHKAAEKEWESNRENLNQQIQSQQEQLDILKTQNETLTADLQSLSTQVMAKIGNFGSEKESTAADAGGGGKSASETPETPTGKSRHVTRGYALRSAGQKSTDAAEDSADKKKDAAAAVEAPPAAADEVGDETLQTPEQMINVNRFLRREKEIAETRVEILQAEVSRLKQHTEYVEKQMAQAQNTLSSERQRATVSAVSGKRPLEVRRK